MTTVNPARIVVIPSLQVSRMSSPPLRSYSSAGARAAAIRPPWPGSLGLPERPTWSSRTAARSRPGVKRESRPPRSEHAQYGGAMSDAAIQRILVGVDGSEGAAAALRWTIGLAKTTGAEVIAVHVFQQPYPLMSPQVTAPVYLSSQAVSYVESLEKEVEEAFRTQWCGPLAEAGVPHTGVFAQGRAGPTLVEEADR